MSQDPNLTLWAQANGTTTPQQNVQASQVQAADPSKGAQSPSVAGANASQMNSALPGIHNGNPENGYNYMTQGVWSPQGSGAAGTPNQVNHQLPQQPGTAGMTLGADGIWYATPEQVAAHPWSQPVQGAGNPGIGAPGYMTQEQIDQARQAPAVIQPGQSPWLQLGGGMDMSQPVAGAPGMTYQDIQNLINQGGLWQGAPVGDMRAPNAFAGPGGVPTVGQGAMDMRDQMGMGAFGQMGQPGAGAGELAMTQGGTADDPRWTDGTWGGAPPSPGKGGATFDTAATATPGTGATTATTTGVDYGTYPGSPKKQEWMKRIPADYNAGGIQIGAGAVPYDVINSVGDPHVASMLRTYNDILGITDSGRSNNYQGWSQKQRDQVEARRAWFEQNLPGMGFDMTPSDTGTPTQGMPEGTRPGTDLNAGLPSFSPGNIPAEITRLFGFQPGEKVSAEKMTAAVSAYMDMLREGRGMAGQQLGVNQMDAALQAMLNDPMRLSARERAQELADMGDPTDWQRIRNKTAGQYAQGYRDIGDVLGRQAAQSGLGTGSMAGLMGNLGIDNRQALADRMGDLAIQEAQSGYDYGLRGIDALTNTWAATQNPLTQAQMMLGQALMGQAPYAGSFGGGTSLFDMGSGIRAIDILEDLDAGGGFDFGGLAGGLGQLGGGLAQTGLFG